MPILSSRCQRARNSSRRQRWWCSRGRWCREYRASPSQKPHRSDSRQGRYCGPQTEFHRLGRLRQIDGRVCTQLRTCGWVREQRISLTATRRGVLQNCILRHDSTVRISSRKNTLAVNTVIGLNRVENCLGELGVIVARGPVAAATALRPFGAALVAVP